MKKLPITNKSKIKSKVTSPEPVAEPTAPQIKQATNKQDEQKEPKIVSFCVFCYAEKSRTRIVAKETVPDSYVGQIVYTDNYSYVHVRAHDHEEALQAARAIIIKREIKPTTINFHEWIFDGLVMHP